MLVGGVARHPLGTAEVSAFRTPSFKFHFCVRMLNPQFSVESERELCRIEPQRLRSVRIEMLAFIQLNDSRSSTRRFQNQIYLSPFALRHILWKPEAGEIGVDFIDEFPIRAAVVGRWSHQPWRRPLFIATHKLSYEFEH